MVNICVTKIFTFRFSLFTCGYAAPLWANGEAFYYLPNIDNNYWKANGWISDSNTDINNPPTAALPVQNTDVLTANTQIFPGTGFRNTTGPIDYQGTRGRYWTSIPHNSDYGYLFYLTYSFAQPTDRYSSGYGQSIRCVRI
jgi:hypothetical protein